MRFAIIFYILISSSKLYSQDLSKLTIYPVPKLITPFFDFENVDNTFSLLPINGGIFCPESNSWYKVPDERKYTSVSYGKEDSSVSFSIRSDKFSYISTYKISKQGKKNIDSIFLPDAGLYFVKRLVNDTLIYGGLTKGYYSIFQLIKGKSFLLMSYKGRIINLQVKSSNSFFFQVDNNNIYYFKQGHRPVKVFASKNWIDGFGFDDKMNLYISRMQGIFVLRKNTASLVLPYIHGPLKISNNNLYVFSIQESEFVRFRL